jgi:hypothetical protein
MAGLTWFELDVDFHESPKVRALASRLREPLADSYVSRIYAYCYRHARDRFDPEVAAETIEEAARWRGRRGVLFDALFAVEVLERVAGKVVVHGVADRLAPHIAKRISDAERQRRRREKAASSIGRPLGVTRDVTRDDLRDVTPPSHADRDKDRDRDQKQQPPPAADPATADDEALVDAFRTALAARLARPAQWFRVASPGNVAETRTLLAAELRRLGVEHAADVAADRARDEGSVKQWFRWYLGPLQDAIPAPAAVVAGPFDIGTRGGLEVENP